MRKRKGDASVPSLPKLKELPVWQETPEGTWQVNAKLDTTLNSIFNAFGFERRTEPFTIQALGEIKNQHLKEISIIEKIARKESYSSQQISDEVEPHKKQIAIIEKILQDHPDYPFVGKELVELGEPP